MTIPIRPDGPVGIPIPPTENPFASEPSGSSFGDLLAKGLNNVSEVQDQSSNKIASFLRGDPVELHDVMASAEEAGIAVDLLVQLRNKLTDAYRTVMNTQI